MTMDEFALSVGKAVCQGYRQIGAYSLWNDQCNIFNGGNPTTLGYIAIFIVIIALFGGGFGTMRKAGSRNNPTNAPVIGDNSPETIDNRLARSKDVANDEKKVRIVNPATISMHSTRKAKTDLPTQLSKLKSLLDSGAISKQEFDGLKRKLLDG